MAQHLKLLPTRKMLLEVCSKHQNKCCEIKISLKQAENKLLRLEL